MDIVRMGSVASGGGSVRRTASSWRGASGRSDAFGRSVREEDDEEALKWAAIEKLPTYDRMRKGILTAGGGGAEEVDIEGLGLQERRNLIERLVRTAEEDNERFLLKLRDRMERVGIDNPTIEVRFENLSVDAEAYVGNRGVPTFTNFFSNKVMGALSAMHIVPSGKRPISILHDVSGIIRPGRMSLLLGPPGSGKTSLLLALAGKLDSTLKAISVEGQESVVTDYILKLFLMKRGGEEIYVGPLGRNSCHLIDYFEDVQGVRKIKDGYNPATWMLEVTTLAQEDILGVNFAEVYRNSDLYQYVS
ncbi:hypothetical protein ABZP36_024052 [Zizania latifolia]